MSDDQTGRLALPLLAAGQAQKEMFHNEALTRLDMLVQAVAVSADRAVPPGDPQAGQCWIVAAGPSGAWSGQAQALACWTTGGWRFCAPGAGLRVHVLDRGHDLIFGNAGWSDAPDRSDGYVVAGVRVLAQQQPGIAAPTAGVTVDAEGRAAITAILTALRTHGLIATSL